jgi:hypothetical protein
MSLRRSTWTLPVLIALGSLAGLVIGLVGDGVFDMVGWLGLLTALLAIVWAWRVRSNTG